MKRQNHLFQRIASFQEPRLFANAQLVEMRLGDFLFIEGDAINYAYFPLDGVISLLSQTEPLNSVEVALVGSEGMIGVEAVLGHASSLLSAVVQGEGSAWRIDLADVKLALVEGPSTHRLLAHYACVLIAQTANSAACIRFHAVEPRVARWLLEMADRLDTPTFAVKQEFLARMIGVRRVSVSLAASGLQKSGIVDYSRGSLKINDRRALEARACSCYARIKSNYYWVA